MNIEIFLLVLVYLLSCNKKKSKNLLIIFSYVVRRRSIGLSFLHKFCNRHYEGEANEADNFVRARDWIVVELWSLFYDFFWFIILCI